MPRRLPPDQRRVSRSLRLTRAEWDELDRLARAAHLPSAAAAVRRLMVLHGSRIAPTDDSEDAAE